MNHPGHPGRFAAARDEDSRVLRRLQLVQGLTGEGDPAGRLTGVVVDVETTGLDFQADRIIELALRPFRFDEDGVIVEIGHPRSWLEDPERSIPLEITAITGLRDEDVAGRCIDDEIASQLLQAANIVIAHNARFDRSWIERRLPEATGLRWACSMEQVDWRSSGFDGRQLGYLLCQAGWYHDGHRAGADVDAVVQLLRQPLPDGRTALAALVDRSQRTSWLVAAVGADYSCKEILRARGYRWDGQGRVWSKEVFDEDLCAEEFWLARSVYSAEARPRASGPRIEALDASRRFL